MRYIGASEVRSGLPYEVCIPVVREAMIAFSAGRTRQLLRSIIPLDQGRMFGVMPGALGGEDPFGAKLVSVFPDNVARGGQSHQGLVVLFDAASGRPEWLVDAGEITAIRTAAASAVATDALARPDSAVLAVLGTGEQAKAHAEALCLVRPFAEIRLWGRRREAAEQLAQTLSLTLDARVSVADDVETAVAGADVVCTVSGAREPILMGRWLARGAHVNLVGSSVAGPSEVDHDVVVRARFIADSREGVLAQGAEFLRAKAEGLIDDDHVVGEIGQVLAGDLEGRQSADQLTVYKSLGHVVQDLAAAKALCDGLRPLG
ncbi:ornithine cyclodeaminase family protein [Caulobacter soli]|uniref:ornithine cyclodeaminase family protein n=1 Tax=Caulobacter soli TaxID=2708539 RepID=UPI0013ED042E|nr:ornithine cyclodeaminase family protein [Caulobacter soli]